jgi:3-hydroxyisobutyrate dehydrogenase-like beta-hydroxyacid dehydrogenase
VLYALWSLAMRVGVVGLGSMGVPIAERILAAGHDLVVFNRTPGKGADLVAAGAAEAESARSLAAEVEACITMVTGDAALEEVTGGEDGILAGAGPDTGLVDMSTVSPTGSARVARAADEAGVEYLRAPVSGNPVVVRAGNLTIVVSGPRAAFDRLLPLLEAIGPKVYYVGEGEEARVVKLVLQVMIGGTAQLLSEALVLGEAGGVARADLLEILANSAVGSPLISYKTPPLLADDYSATFTTANMLKDAGLIRGFAAERGVTLPVAELVEERVEAAVEGGYGELDFIALCLLLRKEAGLA